MIIAIVPAAGFSQRMGCPKLSLPFRGRTVLEHVVRALREGGADSVVVVVGPHVPELLPLAKAAGAHVCQLAEPTPDMRATVEHGLRWIEKAFSPRPGDGWLLAPADHPSLDPAVVRDVVTRGMDGVQRCYQTALMRRPDLAGHMSLRITVDPTGHVSRATLATSAAPYPWLSTCVENQAAAWSFPAPSGGASVSLSVPLDFATN